MTGAAGGGIIEEFLTLVRLDAASREERQIADYLIDRLTRMGCEVREDGAGQVVGGDSGNLIAVLDGGAPGAVLLTAHMDRVAGGKGIRPVIRGDRIESGGDTILAADDLSGVVAILEGLDRLRAGGRPFPRVEILFTVCEEAGLLGTKALDTTAFQSRIGYAFDSPGRLGRIIHASPSSVSIVIRATGRAAHVGNEPEKGIDAAKAIALVLAGAPTGRLDAETTAAFPVLLTASQDASAVCAQAEMRGGARSLDPEKLERQLGTLRALCAQAEAQTGATLDMEVRPSYPGFSIDPESGTVRLLHKTLEEMGVPVEINASGGGMDANILNQRGIACVGVGTGYAGNHTHGEHIFVSDLLRCGELVERLVLACVDGS